MAKKQATKRQSLMLPRMQKCKALDIPKGEVWALIRASVLEVAKSGHWRDSETAMTLADYRRMLDEVYGDQAGADQAALAELGGALGQLLEPGQSPGDAVREGGK